MLTEAMRLEPTEVWAAMAGFIALCAMSAVLMASGDATIPHQVAAFVALISTGLALILALFAGRWLNNYSDGFYWLSFFTVRFITDLVGLAGVSRLTTTSVRWSDASAGAFYNLIWAIVALIVVAILF